MSATVYDRFAEAAARWPDRVFIEVLEETAAVYGIAPGPRSYGELATEVGSKSEAYGGAGYEHGHRVGLLLENRPDFLVHWLALNKLGVSIVPINPALRAGELEYLVTHSEMCLAVALPGRHADLRAAGGGLAVIGPSNPPPDVAGPGGADADECALLYTSGTTGRPKGCLLGNSYFGHCGEWYAGVGGALALHEDPQARMLTPLPLFHVNALAFSVMATIAIGGCLILLDRFHPRTWWQSVRASRATIIHYLGIMPPLWMAAPEGPEDRDHHVRAGFGAGIDPKLHAAAEARFGFPLIEGWAMTETGAGGVIMATEAPRKPGTASFGRPGPGVEARVFRDDGKEAAADEPGELRVRRAGTDPRHLFFSGYLKDPEATEAAWAGGWLHTGDVVRRDPDGDLHFVDRKKNVIRRSGENISAAEVESELRAFPGVTAVAVAPVPDDLRGEEVAALIIAEGTVCPREITQRCLERLAYYKAPGWIALVEELPLTATEKVQRGALRELAEQLVSTGAAEDLRSLKRPS